MVSPQNTEEPKSWTNSLRLNSLASEVDGYSGSLWGAIGSKVIAYRCAQRLDTIQNAYEHFGNPTKSSLDICIVRFPDKDQPLGKEIGGELHFEPFFESEASENTGIADNFFPDFSASFTPLSDFYYRLVQNCYYTLDTRDFNFGHIGQHFMEYMSWSTASWSELYKNT